MGAYRSQHFVPRTYLKHFASPRNPKATGLFNIKRGAYVDEAPIKSQCAKPFLYGHDELENVLAEVESQYDSWVGCGVLANEPVIVDGLDRFLHLFVILQFLRTEYAAIRTRAQFTMMEQLAAIPVESEFSLSKIDTSDTAMVRMGIKSALEFVDVIADLKIAFVRNTSGTAFVTSDDPVAFANRFHAQRLKSDNFGLAQTGSFFWLPLSPWIGVLLYDGDAYSFEKDSRWWATMSRACDVRSLNELIFLKARENIYFSSRDQFDETAFRDVESNRPNQWQTGTVLVPTGSDAGGTVFKRVEEVPASGRYLITTSTHYPTPKAWPSKLKIRNPVISYINGTAVGYVREGVAKAQGYKVQRVRL